MKRAVSLIAVILCLILSISCGRQKGMYVLNGTAPYSDTAIYITGFDSRFERTDTILCRDGRFSWSFRPDTVTTLIMILPDGRTWPVFAEKDVESEMTVPSDTGMFVITGGQYNESYVQFRAESEQDSCAEQAAARIKSFIKADPFSEATPYIIYEQMVQKYHAPSNLITVLIEIMSGNMQDAPYIVSLKSEFKPELNRNVYLEKYSVRDSSGNIIGINDIAGHSSNTLLLCIWASWAGDQFHAARDSMQTLLTKYADRKLSVADISIDVNEERWKEAMVGDTVSWLSYNDRAGWNSSLVRTALVQELPCYIILSSARRIVYQSTLLEEIDKQLDKELPKPAATVIKKNGRLRIQE